MVGVRLVVVVVVVVVGGGGKGGLVVIILLCEKDRVLCGVLCVYVLHIYIRINKNLSKFFFHYSQFIFWLTYACIISTPPLSPFNNNTGQNIDL